MPSRSGRSGADRKPELIPGPRIRSYDARPNSFLNGIGAGRPCTSLSLGSPPVRPDFAGRQMKVVLLKRIARHGFASAARNQIFFLYLNPPSVAWDLRCHEQRPSDPISQTGSRSGGQATADLLLKLADECDQGFSAPLNGVQPGHLAKMSSHQKQETPRHGGCGTHIMTNVEIRTGLYQPMRLCPLAFAI